MARSRSSHPYPQLVAGAPAPADGEPSAEAVSVDEVADLKAQIAALTAQLQAQVPDPAAKDAPVLDPLPEYPVIYHNPKIIDEQFYIIGSPYRRKFVAGVFIANSAAEEQSVRSCLRAHGPDKPDKWRGQDRSQPWVDKKTGFTAFLDAAKYDFEYFHEN